MKRPAGSQDTCYFTEIIGEGLSRHHVVAGMTGENKVEGIIPVRDVRIGTDCQLDGHAELLHARTGQITNCFGDLNPINVETKIV